MLKIIILVVLAQCCFGELPRDALLEQISNTQQLVNLYLHKLQLLHQLHHQHFPHLPIPTNHSSPPPTTSTLPLLSQKVVLLKQLSGRVTYSPAGFLVRDNSILDEVQYLQLCEFLGDLIILETDKITSLVGGKLAITQLSRNQQQIFEKHEYLIGDNAANLPSVWNRNINIKDATDILVQWEYNHLYFRDKDIRELQLNATEQILHIFSLNQYKVLFVSDQRVGTINTRSLQLTASIPPRNSSIICATQQDGLLLLLDSGEIVRYLNDRLIILQMLPQLKSQFGLEAGSLAMQAIENNLFLVHKKYGIIKVFSLISGKYLYVLSITLPKPSNTPENYQFYKINESIRVIVSSRQESSIYQLLLPHPEETHNTPNYIKVIGVGAVILGFLYFKMKKNSDEKVNVKKQQSEERFKYPPELEQILKRQGKNQKGKHKNN